MKVLPLNKVGKKAKPSWLDRRSGSLCPLTKPYEGGPQGVSGLLDTPCRKKRGVPLAKGDKASILAREMYKLKKGEAFMGLFLWACESRTDNPRALCAAPFAKGEFQELQA